MRNSPSLEWALFRSKPNLRSCAPATRCAAFSETEVACGIPMCADIADISTCFSEVFGCYPATLGSPLAKSFEQLTDLRQSWNRPCQQETRRNKVRATHHYLHWYTTSRATTEYSLVVKTPAPGSVAAGIVTSQTNVPSESVITVSVISAE
jgi:hypothetical protein